MEKSGTSQDEEIGWIDEINRTIDSIWWSKSRPQARERMKENSERQDRNSKSSPRALKGTPRQLEQKKIKLSYS